MLTLLSTAVTATHGSPLFTAWKLSVQISRAIFIENVWFFSWPPFTRRMTTSPHPDHSTIPDICHFFYTGKISENKIYTEKRVHKRCQLSNYYTEKYQFCVHSGKIYTGQKKFTPAPPVVPVTNIRYVYCDWINFCEVFELKTSQKDLYLWLNKLHKDKKLLQQIFPLS